MDITDVPHLDTCELCGGLEWEMEIPAICKECKKVECNKCHKTGVTLASNNICMSCLQESKHFSA